MGKMSNSKEFNEFYDRVCKNIKSELKFRGIVYKQIASYLNISEPQFANKINAHEARFNILDLKKIAAYLKMSTDMLLK